MILNQTIDKVVLHLTIFYCYLDDFREYTNSFNKNKHNLYKKILFRSKNKKKKMKKCPKKEKKHDPIFTLLPN